MAIFTLTPVEKLLQAHFRWQARQTWLSKDARERPLVVMANMDRSPAAIAMRQLVQILMDDGTSISPVDALSSDQLVQWAMYLHEGQWC